MTHSNSHDSRLAFVAAPAGCLGAGSMPARRRRGSSVIVVLGMVSISLALSYAMLRWQATATALESNAERSERARQAAATGLTMALRAMHRSDWEGIDSQVAGAIDASTTYTATYETGDPALASDHPDYADWPYRVTIRARGVAVDPAAPERQTVHSSMMVVRLVPRALSTESAAFAATESYTVYQWGAEDARIELPVHVKGGVRLGAGLALCEQYPPVSRPLDGVIDDVVILNSALDADALEQLASQSGAALADAIANLSPSSWWKLDEAAGSVTAVDSVGGRHGTYRGAKPGAAGSSSTPGNLGARFDGHNDYVDLGSFDIGGSRTGLTILARFKVESFAGHSDARIISKALGTATQNHYWMLSTYAHGDRHFLRFRLRTLGYTYTLKATQGDIAPGQWQFVAATYDGLRMRLYLNDQEVGDRYASGLIDLNPSAPVWLGDNPPGSARDRYLADLKAMQAAGQPDWRPLSGPVHAPPGAVSAKTRELLVDALGVVVNETEPPPEPPSHPGRVESYQLYPGGQEYAVPEITADQHSPSLVPDPQTNPLGVVRRAGTVQFSGSGSFRGVLITHGGAGASVEIGGDNLEFSPVELPPLQGASEPIRLPTLIAADDIRVDSRQATIRGVLVAGDDFELATGSHNNRAGVRGRIIAKDFVLGPRETWRDLGDTAWENHLALFALQLALGDPVVFFPDWMSQAAGLSPEPVLTVEPDSSAVRNHWHNWSEPIFAAHPDDPGLRWQVLYSRQ